MIQGINTCGTAATRQTALACQSDAHDTRLNADAPHEERLKSAHTKA